MVRDLSHDAKERKVNLLDMSQSLLIPQRIKIRGLMLVISKQNLPQHKEIDRQLKFEWSLYLIEKSV